MIRRLVGGLGLALIFNAPALAQSCVTYPNTFSNGTTADAGQVNANFACAALLGAARFTAAVGIETSSPTDALDVAAPVVFGVGPERLSLNTGSIGFNRKVATGLIYNTSAYAYQFQHTQSSSAPSDFLALQVYSPSGSAVTGYALSVNGGGNVSVQTVQSTYAFYVNGSAAGTTGWTDVSDERLKTDITNIANPLDIVDHLRGVRFRWRAPAQREVGQMLNLPVNDPQIGFVAQEVAAVVPEAVFAPKAGTKEPYGIKDSSLVPILVEAIKAQQAEIKELQAEVAALKSNS